MRGFILLHHTSLAIITFTFAFTFTASTTIIPGGNIANQTWTPAGNPYFVQGDITVPNGAFLNIQAGTVVQFSATDSQGTGGSRVEFIVHGALNVAGTPTNRVSFTEGPGGTNGPYVWEGIAIAYDGTAAISCADVKNATTGLSSAAFGNLLQLSNCTFGICGFGLEILSSNINSPSFPTISDVQVYSNLLVGIHVSEAAPVFVQCLVFANTNGATISTDNGATATFLNCAFHHNYHTAISSSAPAGVIIRNSTITQNGIGLYATAVSNIAGSYNDVWGNQTNYYNCSPGQGSISSDPFYTSTNNPLNLRLRAGSPCIDAGDNTVFPSGITTDSDGNPRFHDDPQSADVGNGTAPIIDIGPYEYQSNEPPPTLQISQSAPNSLTIRWPTNAVGFNLQSNATTLLPASWSVVPTSPTITGTNNSIDLQTVSVSTLFRLKK